MIRHLDEETGRAERRMFCIHALSKITYPFPNTLLLLIKVPTFQDTAILGPGSRTAANHLNSMLMLEIPYETISIAASALTLSDESNNFLPSAGYELYTTTGESPS